MTSVATWECENMLGVEEGGWWEVIKCQVLAVVMTELEVSSA